MSERENGAMQRGWQRAIPPLVAALTLARPPFHARIIVVREQGQPLFGSSANHTGTGVKFRAEDIQPEIRAAAALVVDRGSAGAATTAAPPP